LNPRLVPDVSVTVPPLLPFKVTPAFIVTPALIVKFGATIY